MNFDFTEDQKALQGEARRFLQAQCSSSVTRRVLDDDHFSFDAELWRSLAALGWIGAAIPQEFGGTGLTRIELCALAEELGRSVAPVPFASTSYVFAEAIMMAGSDRQKQVLLPGIAAGEVIGCLAVTEGAGIASHSAARTTVERGVLRGVKLPVTDGDIATHAVVLANDGKTDGLYVAALNVASVVRRKIGSLDPTRSMACLAFEDCVCEPLGEAHEDPSLLSKILDRAAVYLAFEQVGGADRCLDMAKAYAVDRYAFGRPIGSYQAIKHKLADMYVKNELARSCAYYAAWALSTSAPSLPEAAAAARLAGCDAYDFAAKENLQTHGGMGFTWEADCHLHLRRSRQLALVLGGGAVWRERLVRRLEAKKAA